MTDTPPPIAYDVSGRPYCSACGDSGSGPCLYHYRGVSVRAKPALEPPEAYRAHGYYVDPVRRCHITRDEAIRLVSERRHWGLP